MRFSLWLSGVSFGTHGLSDAEQLISPDHHFLYLKGIAAFHKSMLPLWSNTSMVMSPHVLATVVDSLQLSFIPDGAFT